MLPACDTPNPLIYTLGERCRLCFTCVRECPAKAIRIEGGQAKVIADRCIGCGNCVQVCSQGAKRVRRDVERVEALLAGDRPTAAIVAPSFPAEFADVSPASLVGALRALGFREVVEVAFAADLVAAAYRALLESDQSGRCLIASSCPGVVTFIERYHPRLVSHLAPLVSPMIAAARALEQIHGEALRIVFIGPCIAKKQEADDIDGSPPEVDGALTFIELRELFSRRGLDPRTCAESSFDPPFAKRGTLFALSRGLLQAAEITEDLLAGTIVTADGRANFVEAIKELEHGDLDARLLDVLCCNGCIMGAGMSTKAPLFRRRARVSRYAQQRVGQTRDATSPPLSQLSLRRYFRARDQRMVEPDRDEIERILRHMGKDALVDELNCGACGYETCREHAVAIFKGLAESEMCLPHTIEQLKHTCAELTRSHEALESAQSALMQSEKLASMGQLAAGIAHEVNNPLGTVLMLSNLLLEETEAAGPRRQDLELMVSEAMRCKRIVAGLLHFARKNKVEAQQVDLHQLVARFAATLRRRSDVEIVVEARAEDARAQVDADQIVQVVANLTSNALDAMPRGGRLTLATEADDEAVRLLVSDNGQGIPDALAKKIFEPFFTTKQAGQGTGLGLAVTYGIVKMHHGEIEVDSNADPQRGETGTTFTVRLPRQRPAV